MIVISARRTLASALRKLELAPERAPNLLPPIAGQASKPSAPGSATVQLDESGANPADAGMALALDSRERRRRLALYAVPAALILMVAGWKLLSSNPEAEERPIEQSALSRADSANAAALRQPLAPATKAGVIPPLDTRPTSDTGTAAPMESNTTAAPSMVPQVVAAASPTASGSGRLGFAISPWGEIYVDGRKRGVTPPMTELKLPPGKYNVEIRNTGFAPHTQTIELGADTTLRIKHKFR